MAIVKLLKVISEFALKVGQEFRSSYAIITRKTHFCGFRQLFYTEMIPLELPSQLCTNPFHMISIQAVSDKLRFRDTAWTQAVWPTEPVLTSDPHTLA